MSDPTSTGTSEGDAIPASANNPTDRGGVGLNPSHMDDIPQTPRQEPHLNDPEIAAAHAKLDPKRDMKKIDVGGTNIVDVASEAWASYLRALGSTEENAKMMMNDFLVRNEPLITAAINEGDLRSLDYLQAQLRGRMGRASLGAIGANREAALGLIYGILFGLLKTSLM